MMPAFHFLFNNEQYYKEQKKMAKRPKATTVNVALLNLIATSEAQGGFGRVTKPEADSLQGLIDVNPDDIENEKAAARLSEAGKQYLSNLNSPTKESAGKPMYGIINVPIPASNRGNRKGAGAPTIYPFADMPVGGSFFVPNSDKADAAKKLQSTVSAQNMKYSEPTGETKQVTVTKRGKGNKAETDPATGQKITEVVTRKVMKPTRHYVLRPITKGQVLGDWTAPDDGALIGREM